MLFSHRFPAVEIISVLLASILLGSLKEKREMGMMACDIISGAPLMSAHCVDLNVVSSVTGGIPFYAPFDFLPFNA